MKFTEAIATSQFGCSSELGSGDRQPCPCLEFHTTNWYVSLPRPDILLVHLDYDTVPIDGWFVLTTLYCDKEVRSIVYVLALMHSQIMNLIITQY